MPDADKLYLTTSHHYRGLLTRVEEWTLDPDEIAWHALGSIRRDIRRRGQTPIRILRKASCLISSLPSEPLLRLSISSNELGNEVDHILYSEIGGMKDKRTIGVVEDVLAQLVMEHADTAENSFDQTEPICMYLKRIWETEVRSAVLSKLGEEGIDRLEQIEPLVMRGIDHFARQIDGCPDLKRMRRPSRSRMPFDNNMNLLGTPSPEHE